MSENITLINANELLAKIEERYKCSSGMAHRAYSNVIDDILSMPEYDDYKERYEMEVARCKALQEDIDVLLNRGKL